MIKVGRNDACPCGSGKKHKQCCLAKSLAASDSPQLLAWRRLRRANEGLVRRMIDFALDEYGEDGVDEAWSEFMLGEDEGVVVWKSPQCAAFLPWMLHLWSPDRLETCVSNERLWGVPPTRAFLDRHGAQLAPETRRYLESCLNTQFSFHEIDHCEPGRGFRATDLICGGARDVLEASGSASLEPGDILFATLVPCDGFTMMEGTSPFVLKPIDKVDILNFRELKRQACDLSDTQVLADWSVELRELYLQIAAPPLNPTLPELRNTDGDRLARQTVIFEIDSAQEAFDGLKHLALDATDEELLQQATHDHGRLQRVVLLWSKAGNQVHKGWTNTTLGEITIDQRRLSISVNSNERAAEAKRQVARALGDRARYRVTEHESIEHALASGPSSSDPRQDELMNHPEVRAQLAQMMRTHYESWLEMPVPALDGATPLEAVKTSIGREKVEALIRQIERNDADLQAPLDAAIPAMLRERLGLED